MRDKALAVLLVGGPGLAFLCAAGSSIRWFASTTVERLADWIEVIVGEAENLLATAFSHFLRLIPVHILFVDEAFCTSRSVYKSHDHFFTSWCPENCFF